MLRDLRGDAGSRDVALVQGVLPCSGSRDVLVKE
jgi:hypothetical protein